MSVQSASTRAACAWSGGGTAPGGALVSAVRRGRVETESERRLLWIVIATIPGAIAGLLLQKYAETVFRAIGRPEFQPALHLARHLDQVLVGDRHALGRSGRCRVGGL